ncbi:MAG: hypothetical protein CL927_20245 [Deltaproteobacteria bacterium]|nr:hypothetical protein [Deltaproteobacteria bacterium]HCH63682.1 hypothetical protein [Deltaproteobacteria bacterium]
MYIECENCAAGYELELPPAALAGGRSVKFRCTSCGHSFHVVKNGTVVETRPKPEAAVQAASESEPVPDAPASRPSAAQPGSGAMEHVLLRQDGVSYHVPDVATLQRWIVERRVLPTDELDFGGGSWVKAGERADLAPFFAIVSEVEDATRKLAAVDLEDRASVDEPADFGESEDFETEVEPHPFADRRTVLADVEPEPVPPTVEVEEDSVAAQDPSPGLTDVAEDWGEGPVDRGEPLPQEWSEPPPEGSVEAASPSLDEPALPSQATPGLMGDGTIPLEWDESVPETEEAERPELADDLLDRESADFERSSLEDEEDGFEHELEDDLEGGPTEVYSPSSGAFWPEADPPSSPFSIPATAAETEEASAPVEQAEAVAAAAESTDAPIQPPSEELAWADDLFRDAPEPGEPSIDEVFDEPSAELESVRDEDDDIELVGNAEEDSLPLPSNEDDDWFTPGDGRDDTVESFSRQSQSLTGWLFIGGAVVLTFAIWFFRDGGEAISTPDRITVNTAGSDASPAEASDAKPEEAADPATEPASGDAPSGDGAPPAEEAEAAPKPEAPPEPAPARARPARTAEAVANRGWRSLDRNRIEEAEKHFSDALKMDANHAVATYGLGYIAQRRNDNARAVDLYCRARSLAGSNQELVREVDAGLNRLKATCP